jgi:hypothetical protein
MMSLVKEHADGGLLNEEALGQAEGRVGPIGAERRRGLRINQVRPVKIFEPIGGRYIGGCTADISATGLRIELPRWAALCEGKTLNIHVGLSRSGQHLANRRQMLPARVVWVNREPKGQNSSLIAGVEFTAAITAHLDAA